MPVIFVPAIMVSLSDRKASIWARHRFKQNKALLKEKTEEERSLPSSELTNRCRYPSVAFSSSNSTHTLHVFIHTISTQRKT